MYPGDVQLYDLNTVLSVVMIVVDLFLAFLEIVRAILHSFWPYESHTVVSGMATALNLTGVNLDAVALVTYQYGYCSFLSLASFLMPFLFGDEYRHMLMFIIVYNSVVRNLQFFDLRYNVITQVKTNEELGFNPPGKEAFIIQGIIT